MGRKREYQLEDVKVEGNGYRRLDRFVTLHGKKKGKAVTGMILLPAWMIGTKFDVYLIPKKEEQDGKENNEGETEATQQISN